ncbi:hypothetical protein [Pseudonocardia spinosispora]|uniref:hypothetical protein n=1 Tax=Pseudonocardia spinosispora TaxID=103441 RepID=UPI00040C335D|nr:hypothetical protein [Pseudonocardia spinosispora]
MCGACGSDRGADDWARPFLAGLAARSGVASAVAGRVGPGGPRVRADVGGWVVRSPTGAVTSCAGLGELVASVGRWLGDWTPVASGRLTVPAPDSRRGVEVLVDASRHLEPLRADSDVVVVPDRAAARAVLVQLARPPWSARCYLTRITGTSSGWAGPPEVVRVDSAEHGADLLVWLEHNRRSGRWDDAAVRAICPLTDTTELAVELRAGHVTTAREC